MKVEADNVIIARHFTRRTIILHGTRGDAFSNETRQIARRAIEYLFAINFGEDETEELQALESDATQALRELRWAVEELEEKVSPKGDR